EPEHREPLRTGRMEAAQQPHGQLRTAVRSSECVHHRPPGRATRQHRVEPIGRDDRTRRLLALFLAAALRARRWPVGGEIPEYDGSIRPDTGLSAIAGKRELLRRGRATE